MNVNESAWNDKTIHFPSIALAIKAAELQGINAGRIFLRKVQESFFLKKRNISNVAVLTQCAFDSKLDISEFKKDLYSVSAKKAFQSDLIITKELDLIDKPTIVFFNQNIEEEGIKISGLNSYDIYVYILKKMLQRNPMPSKNPSLEDFIAHFEIVAHSEISIVYDWTNAETDKAMKKLQLNCQLSVGKHEYPLR